MPAKIKLSPETIDEMRSLFCSGTSIPELMSRYDLSRNKITQTLRSALGDEYAEYARRIIAGCAKKSANKRRGRKNPHTPEWNAKIAAANRGKKRTEETKAKISEASKTRFERGTWSKKQHAEAMKKAVATKRENGYFQLHSQRHSEWMKKHAPMRGKHVSEETKQKMRDAKKRFYESGGVGPRAGQIVAEETRHKLSVACKRMWADGRFTYGGGKVKRSKLEKRIYEQVLAVFPDAQHSRWLTVDDTTYVFDIFIPSIKTFIEVNGNYWHLNPCLYEASHHDKYRDVTAQEIWDRDAQKYQAARSQGYRVVTVWEDQVDAFDPTRLLNT